MPKTERESVPEGVEERAAPVAGAVAGQRGRETAGEVTVEVVFALPERQETLSLTAPPGTTAREAVRSSGLAGRFPGHDFERCALGIWGRPVPDETPLRDGDRVEVYRPLAIDPREARRRLAERGLTMRDTE